MFIFPVFLISVILTITMTNQNMELMKADRASGNDEAIVARAREVFEAGGLVIFPTETVYGIGASAASDKGYESLRHAKGRGVDQPFTVHAGSVEDLLRLVDPNDIDTRRLIRKVLPGPVTLIVDVASDIARERVAAMGLPAAVVERIYRSGTVGLRCPDDELACQILRAVKSPVLASSANLRGEAPPMEIDAAVTALGNQVALAVDGGRTRYSKPSTIIRVSGRYPQVKITLERTGVYDERFIRKLMRWTTLFVCSGNTCRSPMAEAIARTMLAKERGLKVSELEAAGLNVLSAGTSTMPGYAAADEAVEVVREMGGNLEEHQSRSLTPELIQDADVIYCMTRSHMAAVIALAPQAAGKTFLLDSQGDIQDPIGQSTAVYRRTAGYIREKLANRLKEE